MQDYSLVSRITLICFLISVRILAQEETKINYFQPLEELFQTELVYPQEKNEFQFSLSPEFQRLNNYNQILIPIKAEYGITNSWQVELDWCSYQNRYIHALSTDKGIGNLQIGTQYSFMNIANSNFHAAAGFEIDIPLRNIPDESEERNLEYEPYVLLAFDFPRLNHSQLFAQAGLGFVLQKGIRKENEEPETKEFKLNGGLFVPFRKTILTSEISWNSVNDENQIYYTPGMVLNLSGGWETGIGVPIGLNNQSDKYRIVAMITFEFSISDDDE